MAISGPTMSGALRMAGLRGVLLLPLLLMGASASANNWNFAPTLTVTEEFNDNMAATATSPQAGWVSTLSPGFRLDGAGARFRAYADYQRENLFYQRHADWNRQQNRLDAFATLEAIENFFFVDFDGGMSQRTLSPFGAASLNGASAASDRVETRTLGVSPYIRGAVGGSAEYLLRYRWALLRSDDDALSDTRAQQFVGSLRSRGAGRLGWFGDLMGTRFSSDAADDRTDARVRVGVYVPFGSHIHASVSAGSERTDYLSVDAETYSTPGVGIEWSPDKNTQFAAIREKRFFGYGHSVKFSHRTGLVAWQYSGTRDVAAFQGLLTAHTSGAIQDLMDDLLQSAIPDPLERSQAVRQRLDLAGTAANLSGVDGLTTSSLFLDRANEGSVALIGRRDTLTLLLRQSKHSLLAFVPTSNDAFADSQDIQEKSVAFSWLHRMTPLTTLETSVIGRKAEAMDVSGLDSTQRLFSLTLAFRLAPKLNASLGYRHSRLNSSAEGNVRENIAAATLVKSF